MLAESLREGLLDGVDAPDARGARVVLHVPAARPRRQRADAAAPVAEHRSSRAGPGHRTASGATSTSPSATSGCPRPAGPIPGFTEAIHAWATGDELADVLEDEEMTGGDFVRNVKQTIDLLRQVADVAPDPTTAATARRRGRRVPARRRRRVERRRRPRADRALA